MKKGLLLNGFLLLFIIFIPGFTLVENESLNSILMTIASIIIIAWILIIIAIIIQVIKHWKSLF